MIPRRAVRALVSLGVLAGIAGVVYARRNPSPCPYSQRWWLELPRPAITRERIHDVLAPQPGERVLEVGPGTGYYTAGVARSLEPDGTLHAVDVQPEMGDHLREQMDERGRRNVVPVTGDAQSLPYQDDSFDAAFLVLVLGEIPDQERALAEFHRVLKPGGRLVVGELVADPHYVTAGMLRRRAEEQGLRFVGRAGSRLSYVGQFSVPN